MYLFSFYKMLDTILWILICAFGLFYGIFHFFGNKELFYETKHINGPRAIPLIGNAYHFIGDTAHVIKQALKMANIYNSPFRFVLGSRILIVTKDTEQIKTILQSSKTAEKIFVYDFAKHWLGNGLVAAEHKIWRIHRKIIQPTFNKKLLESYFSIFSKNSCLLVQSVNDKVDGTEFEISPYIGFTSISNICESSMSMSVESQIEDVKRFYTVNEEIFNYLIRRIIRVWLHSDFLFQFTQLSKKLNNYIEYIHTFIDEVIRKRKENLKLGSTENEEDLTKKRKLTLDLLLNLSDSGNQLNDKELREQMLTIIIAGYDTVARTIDFVLLMLAQQPNVQEKVYNEIHNIYGFDNLETKPVKYEDLQRCEYLERVIKETMRLFPASPMIGRQVSEDLVLGGQIVPKGCSVVIFLLALHRDEKTWPNPLKFDPDRFLPENVQKRHPCAFIPFSFGSRDCIGRAYAMMAMKVLVVTFLRKFVVKKDKFTKPKDIKLKADLLLSTVEPITLRLEKRV